MEKWYTIIEAVDTDTGEIINKNDIKIGRYYQIKKTTKYTEENGNKIKKITQECRKSRQLELF